MKIVKLIPKDQMVDETRLNEVIERMRASKKFLVTIVDPETETFKTEFFNINSWEGLYMSETLSNQILNDELDDE